MPITKLENPRAAYDQLWKEVIEKYFEAFMRYFFPEIAKEIDWARGYVFLEQELKKIAPKSTSGLHVVDKLIKVWRKSGEEYWVLLNLEIQCQKQECFPQRVYQYNYRIFDYYQKPVVSLVLLADDVANWRPSSFWNELWGCRAGIEFPIVKLIDYRQKLAELEAWQHPLSIIIIAYLHAQETQKDSQARFEVKLSMTRKLYEKGMNKQEILELYHFIDWTLQLPKALEIDYNQHIKEIEEELNMPYITSAERIGLEQGIQQGIQQGLHQGIQQGIQQGMQQGEAAILSRQLKRKFEVLPKAYQARLEEADAETLLEWSERVLTAQTLDDVFGINSEH